jgi:hypothetical protein
LRDKGTKGSMVVERSPLKARRVLYRLPAAFLGTLAPLLASAMNLRTQPISDAQFYAKAAGVKAKILHAVNHPTHHFSIPRIQDVFGENRTRMPRTEVPPTLDEP